KNACYEVEQHRPNALREILTEAKKPSSILRIADAYRIRQQGLRGKTCQVLDSHMLRHAVATDGSGYDRQNQAAPSEQASHLTSRDRRTFRDTSKAGPMRAAPLRTARRGQSV